MKSPSFSFLLNAFIGLAAVPVQAAPAFDSCTPLKTGEFRTVDANVFSNQLYPYPLGMLPINYGLKREMDSVDGYPVISAILNIQFKTDTGSDPAIISKMLAQTESCYDHLPKIQDADGTLLKIRLAQPGESAPPVSIHLSSTPMAREDSSDWSTRSACAVIVHETLHLLGLVDLYSEADPANHAILSPGSTPELPNLYDCRKIGPHDSIMNYYPDAHLSAIHYESHSCSCDTTACAHQLDAIKTVPNGCPSLSTEHTLPPYENAYEASSNPLAAKYFAETDAPLLSGLRTDKWVYKFMTQSVDDKPLLYPAEIRMILAPGCLPKNKFYYQCSANAYLTSTVGKGCFAAPTACDDPNLWMQ